MVMDGNLGGSYGGTPGIKFSNQLGSLVANPNLVYGLNIDNRLADQNCVSHLSGHSDLDPNMFVPSSDVDSPEDYDFSDVVLSYISQMLMEEDMEDKVCMFQESAALQAAEKSFYDVLGEKYPPLTDHQVPNLKSRIANCEENYLEDCSTCSSGLWCPNWNSDQIIDTAPLSTTSPSSHNTSSCSSGAVADGPVDSPDSTLTISDIFSDSASVLQFKKGIEEASKFLPSGNSLLFDFRDNGLLSQNREVVSVKLESKQENVYSPPRGPRGKKNPLNEGMDHQGGRSNKQSAFYTESTVSAEMFDTVLLCNGGKTESDLRKALQNGASKNTPQNSQLKGSNGGKSRSKKQGGKKNMVDLRTLLTLCAQAVAADDRRTANEFLKQIREHSSPTGDGMQRLAHYFADGLEARMAGSGTQIYKALISMPTSAADILKAYQLFLAACPFRKISNFFSNKTIWHAAEKASRLHIIDFGIMYGFQWPCLIQRLSSRPGGPPKLRITGIDFPSPGFRPSERVEETGHRLSNYAKTFKVPFEFNAIAQKWETVTVEDLKIDKDEVLVVNCLYRFRNLLDETVVVNSPRNIVLNLIKKIHPDVFILGIVNGAYNAPFFITRFREALFHYSSLFDMLEANIPREIHERMLIEKTIFGREAMNVIACEAAERIERPETYKQWQVRNVRAGFKQLPLNEEIMNMSKDRVKAYHKDFVIDEDSRWLLQGWKGRIVYALSTWRPTC